MDELKKTLKEAATRLTETYANGPETVFYPNNGKPIPEDEPMSTNERDTHFIGFARALLNEIFDDREGSLILGRDLYPQDNERVTQHIARRAYDLVVHVITQQMIEDHYCDPEDTAKEQIRNNQIIDLTKWPE